MVCVSAVDLSRPTPGSDVQNGKRRPLSRKYDICSPPPQNASDASDCIFIQRRLNAGSLQRSSSADCWARCVSLRVTTTSGRAAFQRRTMPSASAQQSSVNRVSTISSMRKLPRTISRSGDPIPTSTAGALLRWDIMQTSSRSRSKPSDRIMTVNGNVCSFNLVRATAMATLQQSRLKNRRHMTPLDILSQSGNNTAIDKEYPNIAFIA